RRREHEVRNQRNHIAERKRTIVKEPACAWDKTRVLRSASALHPKGIVLVEKIEIGASVCRRFSPIGQGTIQAIRRGEAGKFGARDIVAPTAIGMNALCLVVIEYRRGTGSAKP